MKHAVRQMAIALVKMDGKEACVMNVKMGGMVQTAS